MKNRIDSRWLLPALLWSLASASASAQVADNFEAYPTGAFTPSGALNGGGWKQWDLVANNDTQVVQNGTGLITAHSGVRCLSTGLASDTINESVTLTSGHWELSVFTYVPGLGSTQPMLHPQWIVVMNDYNDSGTNLWGTQVQFDPTTNMVRGDMGFSLNSGAPQMGVGLPLITDAWIEFKLDLDLDNDIAQAFYNGVALADPFKWSAGFAGSYPATTPARVDAVDFFSQGTINAASLMYWDTLQICRPEPVPTYPLLYTFGLDTTQPPLDVAVYAPADAQKYVFVARETTTNPIVRYSGDGSGTPSTLSFGGAYTTAPRGLAVNDIVGHPQKGWVFAVDGGVINFYDVNGSLLACGGPVFGSGAMPDFWGIGLDLEGNVYVADHGRDEVYKFNWQQFAACNCCLLLNVDQTFTNWAPGLPIDVAADQQQRVRVTYSCNCIAVYNTDGTLWPTNAALNGNPGPLWGVDATDPKVNTWVVSTGITRRYTHLADGSPDPSGLYIGGGVLSDPRGLEYQKFYSTAIAYPTHSVMRSRERLYVADYGNGRIAVFGENTISTSLPANACAWWTLGEQHDWGNASFLAVDDRLSTVDGTVTGTSRPTEGAVALGMKFSDGSSPIVVPDHAGLNFGTADFTIEGWVRAPDNNALYTLLDKRDGALLGYTVYTYGGALGIQLNPGSNLHQNFVAANANVLGGKWHHFAFVVRRAAKQIFAYLDGELTDSILISPNLDNVSLTNTANLLIGGHVNGISGFLGAIDEVTFYQRALASVEICNIAHASYAGKSLPVSVGPPPVSYCTAGITSSGCAAMVSATGNPSVSASSPCVVSVSGVEGQKTGVLFYGLAPSSAVWCSSGSSFLCVKSPTQRTTSQNSGGTVGSCDGTYTLDWDAYVGNNPNAFGAPFAAGNKVYLQAWFRDPPSCKSTSLSNALELTYLP